MRAALGLAAATLCLCGPAQAEPMTPVPTYEALAATQDGAGVVNGLVRCAGLIQTLKTRGVVDPGDTTDVAIMDRARESLVFVASDKREAVVMDPATFASAYAEELGALTGEEILALPLITQDFRACGTLVQNAR